MKLPDLPVAAGAILLADSGFGRDQKYEGFQESTYRTHKGSLSGVLVARPYCWV